MLHYSVASLTATSARKTAKARTMPRVDARWCHAAPIRAPEHRRHAEQHRVGPLDVALVGMSGGRGGRREQDRGQRCGHRGLRRIRRAEAISRGTMMIPPPTPNMPERNPATSPMAISPKDGGSFDGYCRPVAARPRLKEDLRKLLAPMLAEPRRSAVVLDIDGTLAPIVRDAEQAAVPPADVVAAGDGCAAAIRWSPV